MTPQQQFWNWFTENESELFDFEIDQERVFDRLAEQLHKIDPDLTFEFGPKDAGEREFVISAGGIKRAFPSVSALATAAPRFARWQITAFRPRSATLSIVDFQGTRIHPDDVQFSLLHDGTNVGIHLFIPGYVEGDPDLNQIGYLLLDEALGEYDVESKVGPIEIFSPEANTDGKRYSLSELPFLFDELVDQLRRG
jgi:hypothetical protein